MLLGKIQRITVLLGLAAICLLILSSVAAVSAQNNTDNATEISIDFPDVTPFIAGSFFMVLCVLVPVIWLIVAILIAVWVYKDAEKRGENGALWLIIVILTSIIGLIIWVIVRPPLEKKSEEG